MHRHVEEAARLVRDSLVSCGHAEGEDRLNRSPEGNGDENRVQDEVAHQALVRRRTLGAAPAGEVREESRGEEHEGSVEEELELIEMAGEPLYSLDGRPAVAGSGVGLKLGPGAGVPVHVGPDHVVTESEERDSVKLQIGHREAGGRARLKAEPAYIWCVKRQADMNRVIADIEPSCR